MRRREITKTSYELLGPLFYRFLFKLYLSQASYNKDDTSLLFLARGGIRIRFFYEQFLKKNNLESPLDYSDFYVSRMAIIKANMLSNYEAVYRDFLKEYSWFSISEGIRAFFGDHVYDYWSDIDVSLNPEQRLDQDTLNRLIWDNTESADYLRRILQKQQKWYLEYLNEKVKKNKHVVLVDTGWSGSILNYMQCLDKKREYTAQYFGRYNYGLGELPWFNKIIGVELEGNDFDRKRPVTALFTNRHLIEGLCEIRWPSVTGYKKVEGGLVEPNDGFADEYSVKPLPEEPQAYGVMQYILDAKDGLNIEKIHISGEQASKLLCRRLMYPTKKDIYYFSFNTRSADFGKDLDVDMLIKPTQSIFKFSEKLKHIKNSLWPLGQIVLEFPLTYKIIQFLYHRRRRLMSIYNFKSHLGG